MNYSVSVPGSCGELVQGIIGNERILVTCPIDVYSTAMMTTTYRPLPYKAMLARKYTLEYLGRRDYTKFALDTNLRRGKGMASSSADIAAISQLTALALGEKLTVEEIGRIASQIEPTDGIFCEGIVAYEYIQGKLLETLGEPPPINILVFDIGGKVDTVRFNKRRNLEYLYRRNEEKIKEALSLVRDGIRRQSVATIGQGAVISAYAHQSIIEKPLDDIMLISEQYGASGVNIAHSGTLIGVLFDGLLTGDEMNICRDHIIQDCPYLQYLGVHKMVSGGMKINKINN